MPVVRGNAQMSTNISGVLLHYPTGIWETWELKPDCSNARCFITKPLIFLFLSPSSTMSDLPPDVSTTAEGKLRMPYNFSGKGTCWLRSPFFSIGLLIFPPFCVHVFSRHCLNCFLFPEPHEKKPRFEDENTVDGEGEGDDGNKTPLPCTWLRSSFFSTVFPTVP